MYKYVLIVLLLVATFFSCMSQSIILRPSAGYKYYNTKPNQSISNHFDPSYVGTQKIKNGAQAISLELLYPNKSFELCFTKQDIGEYFKTWYDYGKLGTTNVSDNILSQFQFIYNKFFNNLFKYHNNITPFIGGGFGIGLNNIDKPFGDSIWYIYRDYSAIYPNEYIDINLTPTRLDKISYGLILRGGFAFKFKNIERARFTASYNLGLNKLEQTNIVYYHTNTKYWGASTSKGNMFTVMVSLPIYIKRQK